jgi:inner membrane protein
VIAGALAAAFPDGDFVMSLGSSIGYLLHHRGVTHSLVMLPVWAVLLGLIMALASRRVAAWRYYAMVCGLAVGIHILGDLITSFGTMILAPVSSARFSLGTTFIIDLFLSGILIVGLAAAALWRHSRVPAVAALIAVCAYVGGQAWLREQAIGVGIRYAHSQGIEDANVEALPRPPLPSNWMVVVSRGEEYRYANVNLWRSSLPIESPEDGLVARINGAFFPPAAAAWERKTRFGDAEPGNRTCSRSIAGSLSFLLCIGSIAATRRPVSGSRTFAFLCPAGRSIPFATVCAATTMARGRPSNSRVTTHWSPCTERHVG